MVALVEAGAELAAPHYRGRRGHPVVFSTLFREELQALGGDAGARHVLAAHQHRMRPLHVGESGVLRDIDVRDDLPSGLPGEAG